MKKLTSTLLIFLSLCCSTRMHASITTYTLDKNEVCNRIFNSSNFNDFLSLQEFFNLYPQFVNSFNLADPRYCFELKVAYTFFVKNQYSAQDISQFYANCINMDDKDVALMNESFIRLQSAILNCHLN